MNINWKLRLKNKTTLIALVGVVLTAVFQVASLFGLQLSVSQEQVMSIAEVILTLLAGLGVIVDPTTQGVSDSNRAMEYTEPKTENTEEQDGENLND